MWPYNDDEAGWLKPRQAAEPRHPASANDNEPERRIPSRGSANPPPTAPKS
jgi:hypothetical protein